ncbi:hypothetical protein QTH91_05910 [Variovorax dokdonensis]|uniref:Cyclic nucleotide-binding domain-containing protein n=1 Tax=Variovorax dokdonensis TaxID=344883 RepID=A0ABT7N7T4_9BURK|nr:hypothetical protein [Variovorax dokdonensis]MDM0044009.1 hypothetical protein [Variovorax dokdonensis]
MDIASKHDSVRTADALVVSRTAFIEHLQAVDKALKVFVEAEMFNINTTKYRRRELINVSNRFSQLYWDLMHELVEARDRGI